VVLSASKEIEPGARAMLLLAEGLFRLDVVHREDTLRTIIRNLSAGQLEIEEGLHPEAKPQLVFGEVERYQPGHGEVRFALGKGPDRVTVDIRTATLHFAERGTVQVTAQAIVRQAPES
jgi:hypothetical protein